MYILYTYIYAYLNSKSKSTNSNNNKIAKNNTQTCILYCMLYIYYT